MQEIFFTILVIWILFRVFGSRTVNHVFTVKTDQPKEEKKEGEIKVDYIPPKEKPKADGGEYVDFEEVK